MDRVFLGWNCGLTSSMRTVSLRTATSSGVARWISTPDFHRFLDAFRYHLSDAEFAKEFEIRKREVQQEALARKVRTRKRAG